MFEWQCTCRRTHSLVFRGRSNIHQMPAIKKPRLPDYRFLLLASCTHLQYPQLIESLNTHVNARKKIVIFQSFQYIQNSTRDTKIIFTFTFSWPCLLTDVKITEPLFSCTFTMPEMNSNSCTYNREIRTNMKITKKWK